MSNLKKLYAKLKSEVENTDDNALLSSQEFYDLISGQIRSILEPYENVSIEFESTINETTAYTDGDKIHCNTLSPLVINCDTRYLKYLSNIGSASHECGHCLYTDFRNLNAIRNDIANKTFDFAYRKDFVKRHPSVINYFISEMMDMTNIIEDAYIENCLAHEYPKDGILVRGLEVGNNEKYKLTPSLLELEEKVESGEIPMLSLFIGMLQIKEALGYKPKDWDECSGEVHEKLVEYLNKAKPIVEDYKYHLRNHEKDIQKLVEFCYELLPSDDELFNNDMGNSGEQGQDTSDNGSGSQGADNDGQSQSSDNNSSNNGNDTSNKQSNDDQSSSENSYETNSNRQREDKKDSGQSSSDNSSSSMSDEEKQEKMKKMVEDSQNLNKECGMSKETKGNSSSSPRRRPLMSEDEDEDSNQGKNEKPNVVDQTNNFEKELVDMLIQKITDSEIQNDMENNAREVMEGYFPRSVVPISNVRYANGDKENAKGEYDRRYKIIERISKSCQRKIRQILEKREDDEFDSGHIMGSRFNVGDYFRKDGKYFSREVTPSDQPNVAFSVLIDNSGSMYGKKIDTAINAGILFEDICRNLNIPCSITAHTTNYYDVLMRKCVDFKTVDPRDKYSIALLEASSSNIDTVAVSLVANELSKRPEKSKVLIVISDGSPCLYTDQVTGNDFKGIPFKKLNAQKQDYEMQQLNACVRYWEKKSDIKIVGVAIDESDLVKAIYEHRFLDCTNLDRLPNEMVKLFKKYVLK